MASDFSDIVGLYPAAGWGTSLFLRARWATTPYRKMAGFLPEKGRILDLGSGHGLFSLALADGAPGRTVLGLDHDAERVALAAKAAKDFPQIRFEKGSILEVPAGPFEGISLIDVMHYFSFDEQKRILDQAALALAPGGTLILREVNPQGGMVSRWNQLYEKLATATGFTRSDKSALFFRSCEGWKSLMESAGLETRFEPCSSILFADVLYIGRKSPQGGTST